jgi:hypothetical protein
MKLWIVAVATTLLLAWAAPTPKSTLAGLLLKPQQLPWRIELTTRLHLEKRLYHLQEHSMRYRRLLVSNGDDDIPLASGMEQPPALPNSCLGLGRWGYETLAVELTRSLPANSSELTAAAVADVAAALGMGPAAAGSVEAYMRPPPASADGSVWLDLYIWLSPPVCEASIATWLQLVTSEGENDTAALFGQASPLAREARSVNTPPRDLGRYAKISVQHSDNEVWAMLVGASVPRPANVQPPDAESAGVQVAVAGHGLGGNDSNEGLGVAWMRAPLPSSPDMTGLMAVGVVMGGLLATVALGTVAQRCMRQRRRSRDQAAATLNLGVAVSA